HQIGFEAVRPWTCFLVPEEKKCAPTIPVTLFKGDDFIRPGRSKPVRDDMLQHLCLATRSDLLQPHSAILVQTSINHQGIDGRTEQAPPLEFIPVIRGEANLSDPAPERFFCGLL